MAKVIDKEFLTEIAIGSALVIAASLLIGKMGHVGFSAVHNISEYKCQCSTSDLQPNFYKQDIVFQKNLGIAN
jgi:hypothetical protein